MLVQNSRKVRNRVRRKYRKDAEKQRQQRQHKRMQRIHRAQQLEELFKHQNDGNAREFVISDDRIISAATTMHKRGKRSVSSPRHVEALVVADSSMVDFHQDRDVETYLLTIMNMVSSLYKDPAIGNLIKVVVVRIVLLEEEDASPDLNVTHAAEKNLMDFCRFVISISSPIKSLQHLIHMKSKFLIFYRFHFFCRWQRLENPKDESDPSHHDVAILITRKDICSSDGCT